jgi:predicted ribosome quality control (RQC) complex YloA/Tae2 family protein
MLINSTIVFCLIPELQEALLGCRISNIVISPDRKDILLLLRGREGKAGLYFSAHPENYRMEVWDREEIEQHAKEFQKTNLFWYALGGYVRQVEQIDFDRIIKFSCEKKTQFGPGERFHLIFELTGRNSNVILVKPEGNIVDCLRKIDATKSRLRQVLPGEKYLPPPSPKKRNPLAIEEAEFSKSIGSTDKSVMDWLLSAFLGMDRFLAEKLLNKSRVDPEGKGAELSPDEIKRIWQAFRRVFDRISNGKFRFTVITNKENNVPLAISCVRLKLAPDERSISCSSMSQTIGVFFSRKLEREERQKELHKLSKIVRRSSKKLRHRAEKIKDDLQQAERYEEFKKFGELLMINKEKIKKGQESAELTDVFDSQHPQIEIPLDPKLSPIGNAQRYFKKYKKAKEALKIIQKRESESKGKITQLEQISGRLESSLEEKDLEEIRLDLVMLGLLSAPRIGEESKSIRKLKQEKTQFRTFVTDSGVEIFVGRNNKENDYLTFKFARPDDLWFHAQDVPGSHVLLKRKDKRTEPTPEQIRQAARIAAYYSKARGEKKTSVVYTQAKFVRKPKKAKPGLALVEREKAILVEPGLPEKNSGKL